MPLDYSQLSHQIEDMAAHLRSQRARQEAHLDAALEILENSAAITDSLRERVDTHRGRYIWPATGLTAEGLTPPIAIPNHPYDHTVLAVDGSQITMERDSPVHCYLLNIGKVLLTYGSLPDADLHSTPELFFLEEELSVTNPNNKMQQEPIEGPILGMKRSIAEIRTLGELAAGIDGTRPTLALIDGSLIFWPLNGMRGYIQDTFLTNGLFPVLESFAKPAKNRPLALASYISRPNHAEVVSALRLHLCPHEQPSCRQHCAALAIGHRPCDKIHGIRDRDIFEKFLQTGQRSPLFRAHSDILNRYPTQQQIYFFYIRTEEEIGRVEIPEWVAENNMIDLVHSIVLEQCHLGNGYPLALAEAHEQAVVRAADRAAFWMLAGQELGEQISTPSVSEKGRSKKHRWL